MRGNAVADLLYVCPKCMGFCRTTVHGKSIKCPRCRDITLVELELAGDEWKAMSDDERHKYLADIDKHEEQEAGIPAFTYEEEPVRVMPEVVEEGASAVAEAIPAFGSVNIEGLDIEPEPVVTAAPEPEVAVAPIEIPAPVKTPAKKVVKKVVRKKASPVLTPVAEPELSYIPEAEPEPVVAAAPEPVAVAPIEIPAPVKTPAKKVVKKVVRKKASPVLTPVAEPELSYIPEAEQVPAFIPGPATAPEPVAVAAPIETPAPVKAPAKKVVKKVVRKKAAPVLTPVAEPELSSIPEAEQVPAFTPGPATAPEPVAAAPIETPAPVKTPVKKVVRKVVKKQAAKSAPETAEPSPASAPGMQVNKKDDRGNGREFKQPTAAFGNVAYRTGTTASSPNVWNEEQREAYRQKEKERQAVEEEKEEEKPVKGFFKKKSKEKKTEDLDKKDNEDNADKEILSDIEASVSGAKEEKKQQPKNPKAVRNRLIVASTFSVMVAALATTTFIIPSFRFRNEMSDLRKANVGDIVKYGKYKGNTDWIVLDRKDNRVLCISNYGVGDERADEVVLWETSPVRERLNSTFMNSTFNIFERVRIVSTKEIRENEPDYRAEYVSPDVVDKMFMLKDEEVKEYIASNSDRMTQLSDISVHPACWIDIH